MNPAETGRPAYDPTDLLRLYLYGYLNRVRSSRMLEREANVNVEVMWLLGKLRPDFKTITSVNQKRGLFTKEDFIYDEAQDCYCCPAGAGLTFRYESFELNRQIRYYTTTKCRGCPLKA